MDFLCEDLQSKKDDLMRTAIAAAYPDEIDALRYE